MLTKGSREPGSWQLVLESGSGTRGHSPWGVSTTTPPQTSQCPPPFVPSDCKLTIPGSPWGAKREDKEKGGGSYVALRMVTHHPITEQKAKV